MNKKSFCILATALVLLVTQSAIAAEWNTQDYDLYPGDFNGDGFADVLFVAKSPSKQSGIALSNGSQWVAGIQYWPSNGFGITWHSNTYLPVIGDFNYDGHDDILLQAKTPGTHHLLLSQPDGTFTGVSQDLSNTVGGLALSADQHRIIAIKSKAPDTQHFPGHKLFLQTAVKGGTDAIIDTTPAGLVTGTVVTSWTDGTVYIPMNAQQANVYSGDFNGDGDGDLLVQAKPAWTLIDYDVPIPVPTFRPGSFGIVYSPIGSGITKVWDHNKYGAEWSALSSNIVIGQFTDDARDDIVLQPRRNGNMLLVAAQQYNADLVNAVSLTFSGAADATGSSYRVLAANIDGTVGTGLYLQSASLGSTDLIVQSLPTAGGTASTSTQGPVSQTPTQAERAFTMVARYNVAGQVTGTIAPDPDGSGPLEYPATRNTYGATGLLIRTESGELSTWLDDSIAPKDWSSYATFTVLVSKEFTYDGYGRKASEKTLGYDGAAESLVQYNYNAFDQVNCQAVRMNKNTFGSALSADACTSIDPADRISQFTFDAWNQLTKEVRGIGTSLQQETRNISFLGHLPLSYTDANGNKTELRYDMTTGDLRYIKYPSPVYTGQVNENDYVEYTYDDAHNVRTERKRNGAVITNTWDANNRLTRKVLSDHTYQDDVAFTYDLRGLTLTSKFVTSGQGETNDFDGFGRLVSRTSTMGGTSRELTYQYDDNGNRTRITHPDGVLFEYAFDGLNRVCGVTENAIASSCSSTFMLGVTYQSNGHRYTMARTGGANTTFVSDRIGRLFTFSQDFSGTANDLLNTFTYNPASQIAQLDQSNDLYSYAWNSGRTGQYISNGLNQYVAIDGQSVGYDLNGNLTSDGAGASYTYDMENRLVATSSPSSTLRYDPLGRLSQYTPSGSTATQFLYDGDAIVAEYQGSTMTRRYVHGDQVDEPWVQYNGSTVGPAYRRYLHSDHQGSIIAQSDNNGGVIARLAYDEFGIPSASNGSNVSRFGYTGQAFLQEIGLDYYKARIYSPKIGRFLQTDPIGYKDDFNLYAYVGNDPMAHADPSGTECTGTGEQTRCTLDRIQLDGKKWVTLDPKTRDSLSKSDPKLMQAVSKLELSITNAVKKAETAGNSATLKGYDPWGKNNSWGPTTIHGSDVGTKLRAATLGFSSNPDCPHGASANACSNRTDKFVTFTQRTLDNSPAGQMRTTMHEGIHLLDEDGVKRWDRFGSRHQDPFTEAANELLD